MMESTIFDKALELTKQRPLPVNIMATLNKMERQITDENEKMAFAWIYEGVFLELHDTCSESYKLSMADKLNKLGKKYYNRFGVLAPITYGA